MKILLITDLCPIFQGEKGLPETVLDFAAGFVQAGHEVKIFRPNFVPNVLIRKRNIVKKGWYEYKGVMIFNKNFLLPFTRCGVLRAYRKYFGGDNFDVILAHMPSGLLCADIISKEYKIPMFSAVHASDITVLTSFKYKMFRQRMKEAYQNSVCILPRSFWLKDRIKKVLPEVNKPCEIIYSGVQQGIIDLNLHLERKYTPKKAKIFCASSFIKRKNLKNLILAYRKLKKNNPKISLEIAGEGPLKEKLEKYIEKKNLDVKLLGQLPKEEIFKKMKEADIFCLPSLNETFGMVYMEAMAHKMAVICTQNSGVDGIIEDGRNGFICKKPNKKGIIEALNRALSLKEKQYLELTNNAFLTAKMFSYENSVQNYLNKIEIFKL